MKLLVFLLGFACLLAGIPARADIAADWAALADLRKQVNALTPKDPKAAVAECQKFLKERPEADPWLDVCVGQWQTQILVDNLKDTKTATEMCDALIRKYGEQPCVISAVREKARILLVEKRAADAETLLDKFRELVPQTHKDYANAYVFQRCAIADQLRQPDKVIAALQSGILEIPVFLDEGKQSPVGWMYDRLIKALIAQERMDEALQWAKLRFAACTFDTAAIERGTRSLIGAWTAKDLSQRQAQAFADAQKDPAKPNPLAEVKLPALSEEARKSLEVRTFGEKGAELTHAQVGVQILTGELRAAMADARQLMIDSPETPVGTQEACRILKAADCSVRRANALIEFVKSGAGENPIAAFLKENPAK